MGLRAAIYRLENKTNTMWDDLGGDVECKKVKLALFNEAKSGHNTLSTLVLLILAALYIAFSDCLLSKLLLIAVDYYRDELTRQDWLGPECGEVKF